jgi:hypothetical protein
MTLNREMHRDFHYRTLTGILKDINTDKLKDVYFYLFNFDVRIPDLFSLMGKQKTRRYIIQSLWEKCSIREVEDTLRILGHIK